MFFRLDRILGLLFAMRQVLLCVALILFALLSRFWYRMHVIDICTKPSFLCEKLELMKTV